MIPLCFITARVGACCRGQASNIQRADTVTPAEPAAQEVTKPKVSPPLPAHAAAHTYDHASQKWNDFDPDAALAEYLADSLTPRKPGTQKSELSWLCKLLQSLYLAAGAEMAVVVIVVDSHRRHCECIRSFIWIS